jgi:hypothetical protein
MAVKPTFSGEVQFAGYADGSRGGPRVTLRLTDRAELEKFVGMEGRRFMAVFVEIGDDETPVEEPAPAAPAVRRERMAPLCEWAVMRCGEPMFQRWAAGHPEAPKYRKDTAVETAKAAVLHLCGIESRKELDTSAKAASALHALVRKPYAAWLALQSEVTA